jgi:hypothetical protein
MARSPADARQARLGAGQLAEIQHYTREINAHPATPPGSGMSVLHLLMSSRS